MNIDEKDVEELNAVNDGETVRYRILLKRKDFHCRYCGGKLNILGYKERLIRHPTLSEYKSVIDFRSRRFICKDCRRSSMEDNPFTFKGFRTSYALQRKVLLRLKNLNYTLKMIADELNLSETMVNNYLDSYITLPDPCLPECLGIDELHSKALSYKNSAYICILVDNQKRVLNNVLGSRSKSYLDNYFYGFSQEKRDAVKYVTIDMWRPYYDVCRKQFRNAIIAVDPFHVIEHLTRGFTNIRVNIMKQCLYGSNAYYLLKNWNWLLESEDVDLDNEPQYNVRFREKLNRRQVLEMILNISPVLKEAYFLKEEYLSFNRKMSYEEAVENYDALLSDFEKADIREYREFVSILKAWREEILSSFLRPYGDRKLSNALTENFNGKIRTYLNVSKGIDNFNRFRKRVLFALNDRTFYSLTGKLRSDRKKGKPRGPYKKR